MKKRSVHTFAWVILGAALLFNQVGLHFFHDRHDAHEFFSPTKKHQALLLNHGEHCQVCSLEVLFNVVLPVITEISQPATVSGFAEQVFTRPVVVFAALARGRAPPAVA